MTVESITERKNTADVHHCCLHMSRMVSVFPFPLFFSFLFCSHIKTFNLCKALRVKSVSVGSQHNDTQHNEVFNKILSCNLLKTQNSILFK